MPSDSAAASVGRVGAAIGDAISVGTAVGAMATATVPVDAATVAVGVTSGTGCAATRAVGAAVDTGTAALQPARSTTTAVRPKPINRDTLREIKVQR